MGLSLVCKHILFDSLNNLNYLNIKNLIVLYFFLGTSTLIRNDTKALLNSLLKFFFEHKLDINNLNIINRHLGKISYSEIAIGTSIKLKSSSFLKKLTSFNFLLGIDNINTLKIKNKKNFNIYQGSFFISNFFESINLILPSSIYSEQLLSFINLEGRFRYTNKAITPFKFIFTDNNIIESFSILLRALINNNYSIIDNFYYITSFFNKIYNFYISYLINIKKMIVLLQNNTISSNINIIIANIYNNKFNNTIFSKIIYNYYNSDIFSKKSKIMIIASNKINLINF
jgi:hypothetical protein